MKNKAIFFDRDGTLNFDKGYVFKSDTDSEVLMYLIDCATEFHNEKEFIKNIKPNSTSWILNLDIRISKSMKKNWLLKLKLKIQSIIQYFKSKKERGLKPIFYEEIGNSKTTRDEMLKNLIKVLKKNGWKIKKWMQRDFL